MKLLAKPIKMHSVTKDFAVGFWGDFLFTRFISNIDSSVANRVTAALRQLSQETKTVKLITIISEHASVPSTDARRIMVQTLERVNIKISGTIFEGAGLRASAVRGAIAGLYMITNSRYPQKIFSDDNACTRWLSSTAQDIACPVNGEELLSAIKNFRKKSEDPILG